MGRILAEYFDIFICYFIYPSICFALDCKYVDELVGLPPHGYDYIKNTSTINIVLSV